MRIERICAREILDSRGNPTIEADIELSGGVLGRASVPSGASTGTKEALELRDGGERYFGRGVQRAVQHVNQAIQSHFKQQRDLTQAEFDQRLLALDGTDAKRHLGANALLAVSLAYARACAAQQQCDLYTHLKIADYRLPVPLMNILNGGAHANNNLAIQEFMIVPVGAANFAESIRYGAEVFHALKAQLQQQKFSTAVGDEGGFAPDLASHRHALDLLMGAIEMAGFVPGNDIYLALDVAASEFYQDGLYHLPAEDRKLDAEGMVAYLMDLAANYPIVSIEDGLDEADWAGWQHLTTRCGDRLQLVGDDLFVTNTKLLARGIENGVANAILIKPNQIGTLTETLAAIQLAQAHDYGVVISHRSGETEDCFIADLAVACGCGQIKTGSLSRSDRVAKYNQLLRIEESLGERAVYPKKNAFKLKNS